MRVVCTLSRALPVISPLQSKPTTLKKYVDAFELNLRPDAQPAELAVAVARCVALLTPPGAVLRMLRGGQCVPAPTCLVICTMGGRFSHLHESINATLVTKLAKTAAFVGIRAYGFIVIATQPGRPIKLMTPPS